jgi:hypothetical protein
MAPTSGAKSDIRTISFVRKRQMNSPPKIQVLKPWEVVTCENGHPMYLTIRKVNRGEADTWTKLRAALTPIVTLRLAARCQCRKTFVWWDETHGATVWGIYISGEQRELGYGPDEQP